MTSGAVQTQICSEFKVHPSRRGADAAPQGERIKNTEYGTRNRASRATRNSEPCPEQRRRGGTRNKKRVRA
jgi:hypothetical protein